MITRGVAPSLHVEFKHSHIKQYVKEERALRTETTISDPLDLQRTKGLQTLPHLRTIGRQSNAKLLELERAADGVLPGPHSSNAYRCLRCRRPANASRHCGLAIRASTRCSEPCAASAIYPMVSVTATCARWWLLYSVAR